MKVRSFPRWALATMLVAGVALSADAQGKSKGAEKKNEKAVKAANKADEKRDKAEVKRVKHVTAPQAVIVTREVLVANGYQIVRVTPSGTSQIIYYRRGNMGNGRGLGPVEKIVVVPAGEIVRFQAVPEPLLATILRRLGL